MQKNFPAADEKSTIKKGPADCFRNLAGPPVYYSGTECSRMSFLLHGLSLL